MITSAQEAQAGTQKHINQNKGRPVPPGAFCYFSFVLFVFPLCAFLWLDFEAW
jgi:hypothetical protein